MVRKRKKTANKKTNGKKDVKKLTVQQTIAYKEMGRDGICRVQGNVYSKCIRFYDINYQLAQNEDKNAIFENWCDFLNYFDSSIHFQLSFINHKSSMKEFEQVIKISPQGDAYDDIRILCNSDISRIFGEAKCDTKFFLCEMIFLSQMI